MGVTIASLLSLATAHLGAILAGVFAILAGWFKYRSGVHERAVQVAAQRAIEAEHAVVLAKASSAFEQRAVDAARQAAAIQKARDKANPIDTAGRHDLEKDF